MKAFAIVSTIILVVTVGWMPVEAVEPENSVIAEQLQELGYDVLRVTNQGDTVLHSAVKRQNIEAVKLAIAYGIDPSTANKAGNTPLHIAASKGSRSICQYLVEQGHDLYVYNKKGQTPATMAVARRDLEMVVLLLAHQNDEDNLVGLEDLELACRSGWAEGLALLFSFDIEGYYPSYNAKGIAPIHYAAAFGDVETMRVLVEYGADVNLKTKSNTFTNPRDPARWSGADWDAWAEFGNFGDLDRYSKGSGFVHPVASPLAIALRMQPGNAELIALLEELGAVATYEPSVRGETLQNYLK